MEWLLIAGIALAPVWILVHGIYVADRYEKEPIRNMLRYVALGMLSCIPAFFIEIAVFKLASIESPADPTVGPFAFVAIVLLGVALTEEICKRVFLQFGARSDRHLDEPFDWIVYAVSVGMGFAMVENVAYVFQGGAITGIARAFTAVPEHALLATCMGDRLARAALIEHRGEGTVPERRAAMARQRWLSIIDPTLWHGLYDCVVFGFNRFGEQNVAGILLCAVSFLGLLTVQWVVAFIRIGRQQKETRLLHRVPPVLISRRFLHV
jgi:RsiW-degrading membrane proteinase PrsW (M82 family)